MLTQGRDLDQLLSAAQGQFLCAVARAQITLDLERGPVDEAALDLSLLWPLTGRTESLSGAQGWSWLKERSSVFVTLEMQTELRGCVGNLQRETPLMRAVASNARAAARADPRFDPVAVEELAEISIEVSVLGKPVELAAESRLAACRSLRPHEDGVILRWQDGLATFLPRVWTLVSSPSAFLEALAVKAGMPPEYWGPDVRLERYSVQVFRELV